MVEWIFPALLVLIILAALYRRGGGGAAPRAKPRSLWVVALTTLSGEGGLQPVADHLKGLGIQVRTVPETVGRSQVWKLLVKSGDLPRAREAIARFDMHGRPAH